MLIKSPPSNIRLSWGYYRCRYKFLGSEVWYEEVARSRPPKDQPWYHVLVNDAIHQTYVSERNLGPSEENE